MATSLDFLDSFDQHWEYMTVAMVGLDGQVDSGVA